MTLHYFAPPMKTDTLTIRIEPELKRALTSAAGFDSRTLGNFVIAAARERAEALRSKGWRAKALPPMRDGRRKVAA